MDEAERVADRVAIIDHGELLRLGTLDELKQTIGQGDVVEFRLQGDPANFSNALEAVRRKGKDHAEVWLDGDLLSIRALNAVALLPGLLESLQATGIHPGEMRIRENTLEDVFLQLTGRRLRP
jgi:ABC-2 type transport system ATP-binding protein